MEFNNISFELPKNRSASIKVIGVGGGGSNAVNYMFKQGITGVDFVVSNTDAQALENSPVPNKVQLGASITEGLGAGANPEVGEQAALESMDDIKSLLDNNTKMLFITAGMGGGTGTGAAPIIANIAKDMGILTVGICTAPFSFEGKRRMEQAHIGIEKFRNNVDSLIIINNDKLRELYGNLGYKSGFEKADEVLATAAKGIAEVITHHYATNIDLRDARTVLADSGTAIMGSAKAEGENKAYKAIESALDSPLLNDNKITGAQNVLLLIVSGEDEITMDEIGTINDYIQGEAGHNANIIMGIGEDPELGEKISVTIIATGFPQGQCGINGDDNETIIHKLNDSSIEEKIEETRKKNALDKDLNNESELKNSLSTQSMKETPESTEPKTINDSDIKFTIVNEETENEFQDAVMEIQQAPKEEKQNQTQKSFSQSFTLHTLDSDWEEEAEKPLSINNRESFIKHKEERENSTFEKENNSYKVVEREDSRIEDDPFNAPIPDSVDQQIRDRRNKLKKFNHQFKSTLNDIEGADKIPAYKRKNIQLSEHTHQKPSNYIVDKDYNDETKIRPNHFLHDNVD